MLRPASSLDERRFAGILVGAFLLVVVLATVDLLSDAAEGITLRHALIEGGLVLVGLAGLLAMSHRYRELRGRQRELLDETRALAGQLAETHGEAERWKREAGDLLRGLSDSIDDQLSRWELTPAEKEVARLLLKGLSLKEVASVRGVTEATARQQARAVYRKGGISGRSELSAFFLEDLLAPRESATQ
jgi:DNA-binding CsgD family transcriptional regulator